MTEEDTFNALCRLPFDTVHDRIPWETNKYIRMTEHTYVSAILVDLYNEKLARFPKIIYRLFHKNRNHVIRWYDPSFNSLVRGTLNVHLDGTGWTPEAYVEVIREILMESIVAAKARRKKRNIYGVAAYCLLTLFFGTCLFLIPYINVPIYILGLALVSIFNLGIADAIADYLCSR